MSRLVPLLMILGCGPPSADRTYDVAWSELDQVYALFEVKSIDWSAAGDEHRPAETASDEALYKALQALLTPLYDNHVLLLHPDKNPWTPGSLEGRAHDTWHADVVAELLDAHEDPHHAVRTGTIDGFGYLWVGAMRKDTVAMAGEWLATAPSQGLVLDLRHNTGGYSSFAEELAGWFVAKERVYSKQRRRSGPDHSDVTDWVEYTVAPGVQRYEGPVVVLTDPYTVSGAEHFLMMVEEEPQTMRAGQRTAGAFGARVWRDLPNGWAVSATVDDVRRPSGVSLEGIGFEPNHPVEMTAADLMAGSDPTLEVGLSLLSGP